MLATILTVDAVLIGIILLWLGWINIVGNTDQKGGAGLASFMLVSLILFFSAVIGVASVVINLIWS